MKTEIKKELRYALRSGKLFILLASFIFFALLTPIMLKIVLPQVLESQLGGGTPQDFTEVMEVTQLGCLQSYMGDVFEIGTIIVVFTLCGLTASEVRENTWVLPLCAGKRFWHMVGAKLLVFGGMLGMVLIVALLADYGYSGFLLGFEVGVLPVLFSGLLQGIYMLFLISCLTAYGVLIKKPIPAGFLTLATAYGIHFAASLLRLQSWTPSGLLAEAQKLMPVLTPSLLTPLAVTALLVTLLIFFSLFRLGRMEWNTRNTR